MTYTHSIRVRYGECDMQKVMFNAHYWAYCDDAVDSWVRTALNGETGTSGQLLDITDVGFDFMLKSCTGTWHRAVKFGDVTEMECSVARWGRSSFDVRVEMKVGGELCFEATIVYVSVGVESRQAVDIPPMVRTALDEHGSASGLPSSR